MPDLQEPTVLFPFALLALTIGLSFWKGGAPEKAGAGVLLAMFAFQFITYPIFERSRVELEPLALTSDLIGLTGFGAIAIRARRWWPIVAASLQLLSVFSHFARHIESDIIERSYAVMSATPTVTILLPLMMGTVMHQRRLKQFGMDPAWVDWGAAGAIHQGARYKN